MDFKTLSRVGGGMFRGGAIDKTAKKRYSIIPVAVTTDSTLRSELCLGMMIGFVSRGVLSKII